MKNKFDFERAIKEAINQYYKQALSKSIKEGIARKKAAKAYVQNNN